MGLFDAFKKKNTDSSNVTTQTPTPISNPGVQLLDLHKGDILDLTKYSSALTRVRASAGWDANDRGRDTYDLDLCAYLCEKDGSVYDTVYYGDKRARGIYLDGDNLTGEGEGDDENIYVTLNEIPSNITSIYFAVVIYQASSKGQSFSNVHNAYIRLVDEASGEREICRYRMSEDGGKNTAVVAARLSRGTVGWEFKAIGEYTKDSISSLEDKIERKGW